MMNKLFSVAILVSFVCEFVSAHGRWKCPLPRDANDVNGNHITFDNTGNKYAACGPQSGNWGFGTVTNLKPGWTTLTWEESVSHAGSPFRIAILDETETARVILLDHIPHDDASKPNEKIESTYSIYKMSVNIPDIKCDKCSLQFLYVMTDKSVKCGVPTCFYNAQDAACKGSTDPNAATCMGAPNSNVCVQDNECFSNYHSCTDITISGSFPIDKFSFDNQPLDWPYKSKEMLYYGAEHNTWSNGWLQGIPSNFTTEYTSLVC
jgi:hypothetical protein